MITGMTSCRCFWRDCQVNLTHSPAIPVPGETAFTAAVGFFPFAVTGLFSLPGAIIIRGDLGITSPFIAAWPRSPAPAPACC